MCYAPVVFTSPATEPEALEKSQHLSQATKHRNNTDIY